MTLVGLCQGNGLGEIQRTFVQGPARNHPCNATRDFLLDFQQRLDVLELGNPT